MAEELRFGESRYEIRAPRLYRNDEIEVTWQPGFCNHFRACVFGLPGVFRPQERPWIDVNAASAAQLAEVIVRCPTGALHFRRLDGGPQEEAPDIPEVHVEPKGPLHVRGWVEVERPPLHPHRRVAKEAMVVTAGGNGDRRADAAIGGYGLQGDETVR